MSLCIGIAGAGLLGRLLAFELSRAGHAVEVFDPAPDALWHASGARAAGFTAAGMLSPVAELESADDTVFALGLRALQRWPEIVATLNQPVQLTQAGSLLLAHRGDEGAARRVLDLLRAKAPASHAPTALDRAALAGLEPAVQGPAHAWLLPCEGHIHTVQAMQALAATATAQGARWHWGQTVTRLEAGRLWTAHGAHAFDWVFDVRGLGARDAAAPTSSLRGDGSSLAHPLRGGGPDFARHLRGENPDLARHLRGVRGEIFWLHAPGVPLTRPLRLLHPRHRVYLVPREGDVVVVGASEIESEDRSPVSLRSTVELLAAAHSVLPELAEARVLHSEANLRPALPDNAPRLATEPGLTRLNGLFRHGWLIAPALVEQALAALPATMATIPTTEAVSA